MRSMIFPLGKSKNERFMFVKILNIEVKKWNMKKVIIEN